MVTLFEQPDAQSTAVVGTRKRIEPPIVFLPEVFAKSTAPSCRGQRSRKGRHEVEDMRRSSDAKSMDVNRTHSRGRSQRALVGSAAMASVIRLHGHVTKTRLSPTRIYAKCYGSGPSTTFSLTAQSLSEYFLLPQLSRHLYWNILRHN